MKITSSQNESETLSRLTESDRLEVQKQFKSIWKYVSTVSGHLHLPHLCRVPLVLLLSSFVLELLALFSLLPVY